MNDSVKIFSSNLKLLRKGRGLSQTKLAEKIGITKQSVINYEKGSTFPTGNRLQKLLDALDVSAEQLLGKDFFSSETEETLLDRIHSHSAFLADYRKHIQHFEDDSKKKAYLLNYLSNYSSEELLFAIQSIFDSDVKYAVLNHSEDIINGLLHSFTLNKDIYIDTTRHDNDSE